MQAIEEIHAKIDSFKTLEPGWDSYNGVPPTEKALSTAKSFMTDLFRLSSKYSIELTTTYICPMTFGGVELSWVIGAWVYEVELEINNTGEFEFLIVGNGIDEIITSSYSEALFFILSMHKRHNV